MYLADLLAVTFERMSAVSTEEATTATEEPAAPAESASPAAANAGAEMEAGAMAAPPGVLRKDSARREGTLKRESKNVMFSDGIRPGGDLTELDATSDAPNLATRIGRRQRGQRGTRNSGQSATAGVTASHYSEMMTLCCYV